MVRDNTFNRIRAPDRGGWIKRNWILCAVKAIQHDRLRQDTCCFFTGGGYGRDYIRLPFDGIGGFP